MSKDTTTTAPITEDERRKRQEAADFARASVGLEGLKPSEEVEAQMRRHINGEIDLAEFVNPVSQGARSGAHLALVINPKGNGD
ncbi:antitoxin VbhA family protein [Limnohabitans sp.]